MNKLVLFFFLVINIFASSTPTTSGSGGMAKDKVDELISLNEKLNEPIAAQNKAIEKLLVLYKENLIEWGKSIVHQQLINQEEKIK
jgi:hypothetical protein